MEKIRMNVKIIFLLVMAGISFVIWYAVFYFESHQDLRITFFDVGQGDAIFIEAPNGNQILIDGGPSDRILSQLGRAMPFWDHSIDMLILTHPHADHVDGLLEVLKRYDVTTVLESGVEHSIPEYKEWREFLLQKGVRVVRAQIGQRIEAGNRIMLDVLAPFENFSGRTVKNVHDATVVTRLRYGKISILLMGDAEKPLEYELLSESPVPLDSDILKVGHHGSKTSSSDEFLRAVTPDIAVIQVGRKNRYGHPTQEVLDRLASIGARIFRNDTDGTIRVTSDGAAYQIFKEK